MESIENLLTEYKQYIDEENKKCLANISDLKKNDCADEANIERIKLNIYNIFLTMIEATKKQLKSKINTMTEEEMYKAYCDAYLDKFNIIPNSWRENLKKAKEHNNVIDAVIEENKLSVAENLKQKFISLMEEK